jgi:hypothetical protein
MWLPARYRQSTEAPQVAVSTLVITAWKTSRSLGVRRSMYLWRRVVNLRGGVDESAIVTSTTLSRLVMVAYDMIHDTDVYLQWNFI